ncbi:hypothetical protein ACSS6W_006610 [Trichoderma asperelloides]
MSLANSIYSTLFRKNYTMLATVFAAGFAWEIGFNSTMDKVWDSNNRGRQWKDIRHKYVEGGEDEDCDMVVLRSYDADAHRPHQRISSRDAAETCGSYMR